MVKEQLRKKADDVPIEEVPQMQKEWHPKTSVGQLVKEGKISDIEQLFEQGHKVLESGIIDALLPGMEEDLLLIGQAKGKFGGGQRRIFRQTQKKTKEGNKIHFTTYALIGNRDGYVGVGKGKSKETVPSRDKAKHNARLEIIRIRRGCGSWQCGCKEPHSIPFAVEGRCGSSRIRLMPAPKGKGLCVEKECAKILAFAGVKDIWSKTFGQTKTKVNLIAACLDALRKLSQVKCQPEHIMQLGIAEGRLKTVQEVEEVQVH